MKLAILGGSFNPLHLGHLMLANTAISQCAFDKVLFVPAFKPPHKHLAGGVSVHDRLTMLEQSLLDFPNLAIETCELERKGSSYTIDTITYLEQKYANKLDGKIGLIIGSDLVQDFHLWKDVDILAKKTDILLASRPSVLKASDSVCPDLEKKTAKVAKSFKKNFPYPHSVMHNALLPISSAEIRQRICHGKDWEALVPQCVYRYINDRNLYLVDDYSEVLEKVRCYALAALKSERYAHSMRTAETASLLCEHYGEKRDSGYFAGVAHDMCKEMDDTMLIQLASQDGLPVSVAEKKKPQLLHGRAAAILLHKQFGIKDLEILEAIRLHTFGSPNMCNLAKILYIADKIEPGRPHMSSEKIQKLLSLSLNSLLLSVFTENVEYLKNQSCDIFPETLLLHNSLKNMEE